MAFDYSSGNPDNLVGGLPAQMKDIQGPFYDLRAYLNTLTPGGGGGGGSSLVVSSPVGEVGQVNQCRAGRQLALSDFTNLGLSAPRGLWNLSDLTDASGNGRALTNKGGVGFATGINGAVTTAAQFTGSTGQALYIDAAGGSANFNIATGSWGCWFRTAKRGVGQTLISKRSTGTGQWGFDIYVSTTNTASFWISPDGTALTIVSGVSDVADDRWHHVACTFNGGEMAVYVDGVREATGISNLIFPSSAPLNIGAAAADSSTAATEPSYGRVDEAFVTADVLSEDQIRSLYAARLVHTLGAQPKTVGLNVRRQRRGAALATTDFSTTPVRLYNFTAGDLVGAGSDTTGNRTLTNNGAAVSVAGADGTLGNGFSFAGAQSLSATDAGLPSALLARSYGCWFKTPSTGTGVMVGWGTASSGHVVIYVNSAAVNFASGADLVVGPYVADGQWHQVVAVEDNTAGDLVKRKLYLDGRVVAGSTAMNGIVLGGATRFRVGAAPDGTSPFTGQIDRVYVCSYAMSSDEVLRLYAKASQPMASSPKNAGDSVEAYDSGSLLVVCDTLEVQHYVDFTVA